MRSVLNARIQCTSNLISLMDMNPKSLYDQTLLNALISHYLVENFDLSILLHHGKVFLVLPGSVYYSVVE